MRRINVNLYPKDGYFFIEADQSRHRAASWRAVIKRVTEYRQRQGLPVGNVEVEVMEQACSRNPSLCVQDNAAPAPKPQVTLKHRVIQWLSAISRIADRGPLSFVREKESTARASICAKCPKNTALGVKSCSTCKQALAEYRKNLIGGARVRDARLGGCDVLGADLVTAVHLDEIRVDNPALPANCWRKKAI